METSSYSRSRSFEFLVGMRPVSSLFVNKWVSFKPSKKEPTKERTCQKIANPTSQLPRHLSSSGGKHNTAFYKIQVHTPGYFFSTFNDQIGRPERTCLLRVLALVRVRSHCCTDISHIVEILLSYCVPRPRVDLYTLRGKATASSPLATFSMPSEERELKVPTIAVH
jgi:hypothetical protein